MEELYMKLKKTMPPVPVLMINGCISGVCRAAHFDKTMP